jgi:MFS family permease
VNAESGYAYVRLGAAFAVMMIGWTGMYSSVLVIKPVAFEFGVGRAVASYPYVATMVGFGIGGIFMGRLADRIGVMIPALVCGLSLAVGFHLAARVESIFAFAAVSGLFIGFLGQASAFAPMVADTTHWFVRRRGLAVAIVISGSYTAGVVWPPILQHYFDAVGWRATLQGLGWLCLVVTPMLAVLLWPRAPSGDLVDEDGANMVPARPLGMSRAMLQMFLSAAGVGCCVAMATPQVHIVAHATDLGYVAARGAEMLSLMLAGGVVSRLFSGWISDRIGGLKTLLLGSTLQMLTLLVFIPITSLEGLYAASLLFGLAQGGIVPSYALIIRRFFPAKQAGERIGAIYMFTMLGMAGGGWVAGALYDLTGGYATAFAVGAAVNCVHITMAWSLLRRDRAILAPG